MPPTSKDCDNDVVDVVAANESIRCRCDILFPFTEPHMEVLRPTLPPPPPPPPTPPPEPFPMVVMFSNDSAKRGVV